ASDLQVENDARIQLPAARPHRQSVERGEAHRRADAPPVANRTHRRAVAEMHDDDAALLGLRCNLLQSRDHVLIGQTVEAVAPDALLIEDRKSTRLNSSHT